MNKKQLLILYCFILATMLCFPVMGQEKITILHTNDLHSHIEPVPAANGESGGFAKIATIIKQEKANSEHPVIVLDAGDFLMGTLYQMLEINTGFQLRLMKKMGYDATCIGNHEFDFGIEPLETYIRNATQGDCPSILLSNLVLSKTTGKQLFSELYQEEKMSRYTVINTGKTRIGVFGLLGNTAYEYTTNLKDYKLKGNVKTAREMVQVLLKKEKVDMIICLSHSGLYKDKKNRWDMSEDIEIASKVEGIDLIVSGHTHTKLIKPLIINGTPIVQATSYGKFVGKLEFIPNGKPEDIKYELIPVNDEIKPDAEIQSIIDSQSEKLKDTLKHHANLDYNSTYFETSFPLTFADENPDSTSIGHFIADAMYYHVNQNSHQKADFTLIAQGMIRAGLDIGKHTLPDIYRVASLGSGNNNIPGYPLACAYFTGHEIKQVLEMLYVMSRQDPTYHCFTGGANIVYDPNGNFFNKIKEIILTEGYTTSIDVSKKNKQLYAIVADSYMINSFSIIRKKSVGLINAVPKTEDGSPISNIANTIIDFNDHQEGIQEGKVWESMLRFASVFEDSDGNGVPEVPAEYKTGKPGNP